MIKKPLLLLIYLMTHSSVLLGQSIFPLIDVRHVATEIIYEIRYAGAYNFVGEKVDGYQTPKCYLSQSAANALNKVQQKLNEQNYALKVFDCYRPQQAVNHFVRWAKGNSTNATKSIYFPNVPADSLFDRGYIAERSGHSRGSTIDLTIVNLPYVAPTNFEYNCLDADGSKHRGSELDMGTAYDCFDEKSHTMSKLMPDSILLNRTLLLEVMEAEGFVNYSKEWWHFTFKPEEFPDTYFNVPIE